MIVCDETKTLFHENTNVFEMRYAFHQIKTVLDHT
jgi:hypothetical protein